MYVFSAYGTDSKLVTRYSKGILALTPPPSPSNNVILINLIKVLHQIGNGLLVMEAILLLNPFITD